MSGNAFIVTGTDTGVGKTEVSCAIVRGLVSRGVSVGVFKPAETGVLTLDGQRIGDDCLRLAEAAGGGQSPADVASYLFELPAAPLVSAEAENAAIDTGKFADDFARIRDGHDITLVEGAGGLLVPITTDYTYCELASDLALPVLVVVGSRLGCINHALLTLEVLDKRGLTTIGYVINHLGNSDEDRTAAESNRKIIGRFSDARNLGVLPHIADGAQGNFSGLDLDAITAAAR